MSYKQEEEKRSIPHALESHFDLLANPHTNRINIDLLINALFDPLRTTPTLELRALTEIRDEHPDERNYKVQDLVNRLASKVQGYKVCEDVISNWWESYQYVTGNPQQSSLSPLINCLNASTKRERERENYERYTNNMKNTTWKRSDLIETVVTFHSKPQ